MIGAIIGDVIGSRFEFHNHLSKEFEFLASGCEYTDDTVMTCAVAQGLMDSKEDFSDLSETTVAAMQHIGRQFPYCGYGARFVNWMFTDNPQPYNSCGNGSAMRVAAAGWLFDDLDTTRKVARWTSEVTHNHPEGVKGAEATASAIFMARNGSSKEEIKDYIISEFDYDLSRTCDEIRPNYYHVESCQETVPEAIAAFMEGNDFEDVIRTAVSLGGDCDTLTCIAGSIAEAYYGVPEELKKKCENRLPVDMLETLLMLVSIQ